MTDLERDEIEALAAIEDVAADAVIAEADADLADLALDAAAELEQDLELEEAIAEVATEQAAVTDESLLAVHEKLAGGYDMLILDEINNAVKLKLVDLEQVLEILREETENALALLGCRSPAEVTAAHVKAA